MHHLWAIPELVSYIFEYLERQDQASVALVCRVFSTLATSLVWHKVDNFSALANLLPGDSISLDNNEWFTTTRSLSSLDWERFVDRASMVKTLEIQISPEYYAVQQEMAEHALQLGAPLFPNLKRLVLDYYPFPSDLVNILKSLMNPDLLDIEVPRTSFPATYHASERANTHLTRLLTTVPRSLRALSMEPVFQLSLQSVCALVLLFHEAASLRSVHLVLSSGADIASVLLSLSKLEGLERLALVRPRGLNVPDVMPRGFPRLVRLRLFGPMHDMLRLISSITSPDLTCITLSTTARLPSTLMPPFSGLGRFISLQIVRFHFGLQRLQWKDLEPLLVCHRLRTVYVSCREHMELTEDALVAMASSWPDLQDLELIFYRPPQPNGKLIPIQALECLPRKCPSLRHICVPLDVSVSSDPLPVVTPSNASQRLSFLNLRSSEIGHSIAEVATFLTALWPSITRLGFSSDCDTSEETLCQNLQDKMEAILGRLLEAHWFC
ncbi:hypothetical protein FRB99_004314 [Tulasnella sp. 403]|nr:hypothetical protein FRB99_004314 [Tulasnella sp. 403]